MYFLLSIKQATEVINKSPAVSDLNMDSEDEMEKMAETLAMHEGLTKLKALSILQSRYQSERRLEEALRVKKIMDREESKPQAEKGLYDES